MIIGEIAMGSLRERRTVLSDLPNLPTCTVATHGEVMVLADRRALFGRGLGYIDAHLLAATALHPGTTLWTRDRLLNDAADLLGIAATPA